MQILLGSHETIIKINSSSNGVEYIQHYISTHFIDTQIQNNFIYIPASKLLQNHRLFLLKWIYTLYEKRTQNSVPELKKLLIKRYDKAIKIQLKENISYKISYKIINEKKLQISISPKHHKIAHLLKTSLQVEMQVYSNYLEILLSNGIEKKRLKKFLQQQKSINLPYEHVYDKKSMEEFLSASKPKKLFIPSPLSSAYIILGVNEMTDTYTLKKSYKSLAKQYHPDRVKTDNEDIIKKHTKKFQNILAAYELVSKHLKHKTYQEAS